MSSYVLLERQNLEEMLGKLSQEEDIADSSNSSSQGAEGGESTSSLSSSSSAYGNVYNSSTSMFVFIKNSIKRCTALSNGQTFLLLCKGQQQYIHPFNPLLNTIFNTYLLNTYLSFLSCACKEFQNCLAKYCELLKSRCPTPIVQLNSISGSVGSTPMLFSNLQSTMSNTMGSIQVHPSQIPQSNSQSNNTALI